jgi:hypothetical protein
LINEYVLKPQKLVKKDFDEKRGFSVIIPTKDQESRESEEAKRTSKDSSGSAGAAGYQCGDNNLTERFNVNNTELNKRRFME